MTISKFNHLRAIAFFALAPLGVAHAGAAPIPARPSIDSQSVTGAPAGAQSQASPVSPAPVVLCYLTPKMASSVKQGWRTPQTNLSVGGQPISIANARFEHGLGTHAPSELVFPLERKRKRFTAEVGVDDTGGATGSVVFKALVDGKQLFDSGLMRWGQPAKKVDLDVTSASELRLIVTDGGDGVQGDHADWADAAVDDVVLAKPVPAFSTAGFFAVPGSERRVASLNPGWRFLKKDAAGAENPEFDDSHWEAANLPHGLEILGENASGCRNYQGPAWYRKQFEAPLGDKGEKVFLYFEGVMGKCAVWVNGTKVAEHFGGYLPFAAEVRALLRGGGKPNVLAVRADNSDDPTYPPGKPQNSLDFAYLGGIYRDVYLIHTGPVFVTLPELSKTIAGGGVFVGTKDVHDGGASIEVRTEVANGGDGAQKLTLRSVLEDAAGKEVIRNEQPVDLAAGANRQLTQALEPKQAHLWTPDDPYLHFLRTEIVADGRVVDSLRTRFGIRLFEMRGKDGLFVNKKYVGAKLNGVNRHQDYLHVGNALPNSGQWRDVKLLREGGVNFIRVAHYPADPAFYDACDELGMLVTTANPGWQFFNNRDAIFEKRIYDDTRALVRRDRNRAALLLWEVALNETPNQPGKVLGEMHRIAHAEYPFPGMFTVADATEAKKGGLDFYYHGGLDQPVNSLTREYGDGGEVDNFFSHNATTRVKREWGEFPLLQQAAIRARDLDSIYATPRLRLGAALWCGIDHQRGYHPDPFWGGLLDGCRVPRYAYDLFKSQYPADYKVPGIVTGPMVSIAHELTQVSGRDIIVYSNCEEVRLTWLGKPCGTQKPDAGYRALPHPPFTFKGVFDFAVIKRNWRSHTDKIELIVEGLIGGKVVAKAVKPYAERTTGIRLVVDDEGIGLSADGSDFVPIRAVIVDNKGIPKVLASEDVYFEVEGPADIVGGSVNRCNPARSEFGTATALLRARTTPGVIKVRAYARGLASGEVCLASRSAALPTLVDPAYVTASRMPDEGNAVIFQTAESSASADVNLLRAKIRRLELEAVNRQQELMELRSKSSGRPGE